MAEIRSSKLKTETLRTEYSFGKKLVQMEFGKPIKLPYIRNIHGAIDRRSMEGKKRQYYNAQTKKKKIICNTSQMDLLTIQQLELCGNYQHQGFPKLLMYPSRQNTERLTRIKSQKNITKIQNWETLKDYKIGSLIGRGGYSTVRIAKNHLGKKFAIKTYQKSKLVDQNKKQNLQREIQVLKLLKHPNIVVYQEIIQTQQSINIVTELLDSTNLDQYLKMEQKKKIEPHQCMKIMKQILNGFAYMHQLNIVHRDVKLQNILISKDKTIKIIDFGFSIKDEGPLYDFCGTPHYIAPQVLNKKGYYGKPADIWSLGVLLYKLVAGYFPFKGVNEKWIYMKTQKGQFRLPPQLPSQLQIVLTKMLASNPKDRPSAAQILAEAWFME